MNISEKNKFFLWLIPKCGTTHAVKIFNRIGDDIIFEHTHDHYYPENHLEYDFIATIRNPYSRFVSLFRYSLDGDSILKVDIKNLKSEFNDFVSKMVQQSPLMRGYYFKQRLPDYTLRLEHLYYDYIKIPFILKSPLYRSSELLELCRIKENESPSLKQIPWQDFYTETTADLVYYSTANTFELGQYKKDSWRS